VQGAILTGLSGCLDWCGLGTTCITRVGPCKHAYSPLLLGAIGVMVVTR
jgi:hypothetical protein